MRITKEEAASMLLSMDNILIFAHENPDGDAVGSTCALCKGLLTLGKTAAVWLSGTPKNDIRYTEGILFDGSFTPEHIVTVDTADNRIMCADVAGYSKETPVELCIDHHYSNTLYAENTYLDDSAAAAGEAVYDILREMNVALTPEIAECIYVAVATDTGCFKYSNVTAKTHMMAASLYEFNLEADKINRLMFDTKSKKLLEMEQMVLENAEFHFDDKCIILTVTAEMQEKTGLSGTDLEGIALISRSVEGVKAGITIKQSGDSEFKVSLRTFEPVNASAICKKLGGGGHKSAAGAKVVGTLEQVKAKVLAAVKEELEV